MSRLRNKRETFSMPVTVESSSGIAEVSESAAPMEDMQKAARSEAFVETN